MRSEWRVAPDTAQQFIVARYGGTDVETLRRGLWSSAYAFSVRDERLVIRFGSIRDDFEKDRFVARRAPASLPVPEVIEIGEGLGGYYAVTGYLPGRHLDGLSGDEMRGALPSLFDMLDRVRGIDLAGTTGYGLWDASGNGERVSWREALLRATADEHAGEPARRDRIAAASLEAARALRAGSERICELLAACSEDRHLVHSDLLHYNVLVLDDRVTALLDWGSSTYGDFLYDIAWLSFWAPWYPAWSDIDFPAAARKHYDTIGLSVPHFDERLRCYELHVGVDSLNWYVSRRDAVNLDLTGRRIRELLRS